MHVDAYLFDKTNPRNLLDSWLRFRLLIRIRCKELDRGPAMMTVGKEDEFNASNSFHPFLKGLTKGVRVGILILLFYVLTRTHYDENNKIPVIIGKL